MQGKKGRNIYEVRNNLYTDGTLGPDTTLLWQEHRKKITLAYIFISIMHFWPERTMA